MIVCKLIQYLSLSFYIMSKVRLLAPPVVEVNLGGCFYKTLYAAISPLFVNTVIPSLSIIPVMSEKYPSRTELAL